MKSSDDAYELEALLKEAEAQGLTYQKVFVASTEIKAAEADDKHTAIITASTEDVDRDGEVVLQKGISLKLYRKNPVIAWGHDYTQPPIGRSLWEKIEDGKLKSKVQFALRPEDWPEAAPWFPDQVYALCLQGVLKGVSIGFLPLEASNPTTKEIEHRPELAACKRMIRKSALLEISVVPIGCNPSALIESVSKGLVSEELAKLFNVTIPQEDVWLWETKDYASEPAPVVLPSKEEMKLAMLKKLKLGA